MAINRDRPATNPGGMQCEACDEIFIGEEWHTLCAVCVEKVFDRLHDDAIAKSRLETHES